LYAREKKKGKGGRAKGGDLQKLAESPPKEAGQNGAEDEGGEDGCAV